VSISVRYNALTSLAQRILIDVPELADKIEIDRGEGVSQGTPFSEGLPSPSLLIVPQRFVYVPNQAVESFYPAPDKLVVEVGHNEGSVQLYVASDDIDERENLEQAILDIFYGQELSPGVLMTHVDWLSHLGPFSCAWELESSQWQDEMVFDRARRAFIELFSTLPCLGVRRDAWPMDTIRVALTEDFETVYDETVAAGPFVEVALLTE
jgi:hypothetical protein